MFCTSCGKEIINTARFCNYCGNPVRNIAPPTAPGISQNPGQPYYAPISDPIAPPQSEAPQSVPVSAPANAPDEFAQTDALSDVTSDIISDSIDVLNDTEATPSEAELIGSETAETSVSEETPTDSEAAPMTSEAVTAPEAAREFSQPGAFANAAQPFAPNGAQPYAPNGAGGFYSAPIPPQYPTPGNIPKSGFSAPGYQVPSAPAPREKPRERKYTLGHIMLCLAAVAVMAITAGVFAGLYFSVV